MTDWVAELDNLTPSTGGGGGARQMPTQTEELEQEMKLLNWHKLANEAALKAALIRTKKLRRTDNAEERNEQLQEKAQWMHQIIEEEQSKPLAVDSEFISKYQKREAAEEDRLDEEVRRHVMSLKKLRETLAKRESVRARNIFYKQEKMRLTQAQTMALERDQPEEDDKQPNRVTGTLSKVIHSLDKLVDLEKRISMLEADSAGNSELAGGTRLAMQFSKKRSNTSMRNPSKNLYSVQVKQGARRGKLPGITGGGGGSSTFMTSLPEVQQSRRGRGVGAARSGSTDREKRRHKAQEARARQAQRAARQDLVINDWLKKKKKEKAGSTSRIRAGQRTAIGAASGKRTGNAHMQQFHNIRQQFERKKDKLARNLAHPKAGVDHGGARFGGRGTRRGVGARSVRRAWGTESTSGSRLGGSRGGSGRSSSSLRKKAPTKLPRISNNQTADKLKDARASAGHTRTAWG